MEQSILLQDVSNLAERERFELLNQVKINKSVLKFLKDRLKNLTIEIGSEDGSNILELSENWKLEGWSWQTTESAIVFFEGEDDCIERGNLKFGVYKNYWHSWITFKFEGTFYVFDPCLKILTPRNIFYHVFEITKIAAIIPAKEVYRDLILRITNKGNDIDMDVKSPTQSFLLKMLERYSSEKAKNETPVYGNDSVFSTMYRNSTGYTATIEKGKITELIAHFYYNG